MKFERLRARKILAALTAVTMILPLAACSDKQGTSEESEPVVTTEPIVESVGDLDYSDVPFIVNEVDYAFAIEAEDCTLSVDSVPSETYVSITSLSERIEFEVDLPCDGDYDIILSARSNINDGRCRLYIDDEFYELVDIGSSDWSKRRVERMELTQGVHKIQFATSHGSAEFDNFEFVSSPSKDLNIFKVTKRLSNPNADDPTKRLFSFLCDVYGKYIISGQSADNSDDAQEFVVINRLTGEKPAILGLDLMDASPSRVSIGGSSGAKVQFAALMHWRSGGIVSLCWHWNAPEPYLYKDNEPWWSGFYTRATTFDLAAALNGSDPEGYDLLISDIDAIAAELQQLEDNGIPVLWRPLHEGSGGWFWWGASGAEAYKELWILMYDRLTNYHKLNNLIWVWNGQAADWYPGDEYCDVISWDIYANKHDYSSQINTFNELLSISDDKIIALSENGVMFDPDEAMKVGARWSWFSVWNGEFIVGSNAAISDEYTELEMIEKVYTHDRVLTLSELPDLTCYPIE